MGLEWPPSSKNISFYRRGGWRGVGWGGGWNIRNEGPTIIVSLWAS